MGSAAIDDAFGEYLLQCGLDRMSSPGIYRGTHRSDTIPDGQNVFISIGDSEDLTVMCPIGAANSLNNDDLAVAREANDECTVLVVGSFGAFTRPLVINEFISEPSKMIDKAVELAEYTQVVRTRLARNQTRKYELLEQLQTWSNDYESVSAGRVAPADFEAAVRETLVLIPKQALLDEILKDAMNENMRHWASSGVSMSDSPWHDIAERLQQIKDEYGWRSDVQPNIFSGAATHDDVEHSGQSSAGKVWDRSFTVIGSIDPDGSVWDSGLNKRGSVDANGSVWSSTFDKVATVDGNGSIWSPTLDRLGSVDQNNAIWTMSFDKVGTVDGGVSTAQVGGAAVLLGLLP